MLYLYLVCAGFAGTFIAFTLATGADGAAGELDLDADGASHAHGSHASALADPSFSWLPITSLRFWTFAVAFFGLTGLALTWLAGAGTIVTLILAVVVGWVCGVIASWVTYVLAIRESTSHVSDLDLEGTSGVVIVGFTKGEMGKIRIEAKGRVFDVLAHTEDDTPLSQGTQVLIISMAKGQAVVAPLAAN